MFYVRNGIDKDVFAVPGSVDARARRAAARSLVEGSAGVWFKGVADGARGGRAMEEAHHVTVVAPDAAEGSPAPTTASSGRSRTRSWPTLYARADVVLKLSSCRGHVRPAARGLPPRRDLRRHAGDRPRGVRAHGWNGLVVDWDDPRGTARMLDLLARPRLPSGTNAVETARGWPSWDQSTQFMALALEAIRERPAEGTRAAGYRLASDVRLSLRHTCSSGARVGSSRSRRRR